MKTVRGRIRSFSITLFVLLILLGGSLQASSTENQFKGIIGLYGNGAERIMIRENKGEIELLYNTEKLQGRMFLKYAVFPLLSVSKDRYTLLSYGPIKREDVSVRFDRDKNGRGSNVVIGPKQYKRKLFDVETGGTFKIKPLMPSDELRKRALSAEPPKEKGVFLKPELVELVKLDPTMHLDIRYAGTNNFMGIKLYDEPRAFLQREAARSLVRVNSHLGKYGYGIVIYDAYRPWYVTKMFFDATPEAQKAFVADPSKGSRHNRGGAVDLGLYDLKTGSVMDMGSGYDEFSIRAYPGYPGGTEQQRELRNLLRVLMEGEGFKVFHNEWWHFDYKQWPKYPILNLRFNEI